MSVRGADRGVRRVCVFGCVACWGAVSVSVSSRLLGRGGDVSRWVDGGWMRLRCLDWR